MFRDGKDKIEIGGMVEDAETDEDGKNRRDNLDMVVLLVLALQVFPRDRLLCPSSRAQHSTKDFHNLDMVLVTWLS